MVTVCPGPVSGLEGLVGDLDSVLDILCRCSVATAVGSVTIAAYGSGCSQIGHAQGKRFTSCRIDDWDASPFVSMSALWGRNVTRPTSQLCLPARDQQTTFDALKAPSCTV